MSAVEHTLHDALKELVEACAYVQPISGTMAGDTILNMRRAFRFMAAVEQAQKLLADEEPSGPLPRVGWIIDGKVYEDRVEADRAYRAAIAKSSSQENRHASSRTQPRGAKD